MAAAETICVEVVVALPGKQELVRLRVPADATAADALLSADLGAKFPGIDLGTARIAIWGKPAERICRLRDGDRVEVLRELEIDPREARRELARAGQFMGGSGDDA